MAATTAVTPHSGAVVVFQKIKSQLFNLTLDITNYYTTLFSPKVGTQYGTVNYNQELCFGTFDVPLNATRNWFQPGMSRTMRRSYKRLGANVQRFDILGYPYTNACGSDAIANTTAKDDYLVHDTFSIGNLSLTNTPVSVVDNAHFMLNPRWPSDGILGISRYFSPHLANRTNASNSALERILTAFDGHNTTATIVLDSGPISGPSGLGGWITFGGKDEESCGKEWIYPEGSPAWNINVTSFSLGSVSYNCPMLASIDTMSTFIRLPQSFVENVIGKLGALYDFESDAYYIDCADVPKLPDLSLRTVLGNLLGRPEIAFNVPARDYAKQVCLWCCACMTCMILAINRCVDVLQPPWMGTLFGGYRTYAWLALPTVYGLYFTWFTPPLIYTSVYYADFFDPFVGMEEDHQQLEYTSWPHTINNIVVITVLISAYTFLCGYVIYRSRLSNSRQISLMQRQMVIQATLICSLILIAATVYVYMQFFSTPAYLVVLGQMTWQGSHGGAVFIYIFLNKSMRRAVADKFFPATPVNSIADITTTISNRLPKFPTKLRAGVAF